MQNRRLFLPVIAITAWFALGLQLFILLDNTPGNGLTPLQAIARFFIFFTILSNLLVALSTTVVMLAPGSAMGRFFNKPSSYAATALYIFIVGAVYNLVLRSLWQPQGLQKIADELLHVAVPALYILYWLLAAPKYSLQWSHAFKWLLFPFFYVIYALTRGSIEGFYAYPFIDVAELGYSRVLLNCVVLMIAFILIGLLFIFTGRKISTQKRTR